MCSPSERVAREVVRHGRVGVAVALSTLLAAVAACDTEPGRSRPGSSPSAQATTLTEADLDRAAITDADMVGYEVRQAPAAASVSGKTADPAACAPVMHAVGDSSGHAATARIGRSVRSKDPSGPNAQLTLSSHDMATAQQVMSEPRTAAGRCPAYRDVPVDFAYEAVQLRPDPAYGDEAVSLRLTQLAADTPEAPPIRVPCAAVAVRRGTTIAMFTTFSLPHGPRGEEPVAVPEAIVEAQLDKLDRPTPDR